MSSRHFYREHSTGLFPMNAGRRAGCGASILRIQPVRRTGLIHDLVEGAADGRGGLQPSHYNMDMMLTVVHAAAVFLICQIYNCLGKYGLDKRNI